MRVLVTGGAGHVGSATVADLAAHGHEVVSVDQKWPAGPLPDGARFILTDLADIGQVTYAMEGCDAVVHLGAIPNPYRHADSIVFLNNVSATYAVFQAARFTGVKKIAYASSLSALGTAFSPEVTTPQYVPVDEAHPFVIKDPYALSKDVDERIAHMFYLRDGMQTVGLRYHWVATAAMARSRIAEIDGNPADHVRVLWGYVDLRDAARIARLAVEADGLGYDAFVITAKDTLSTIPTETLLRTYTPHIAVRTPITGHGTCWDIAHAKAVLGWEPAHSWRDAD
jgi:nucleoside-diphosphate-sugar epimerase